MNAEKRESAIMRGFHVKTRSDLFCTYLLSFQLSPDSTAVTGSLLVAVTISLETRRRPRNG